MPSSRADCQARPSRHHCMGASKTRPWKFRARFFFGPGKRRRSADSCPKLNKVPPGSSDSAFGMRQTDRLDVGMLFMMPVPASLKCLEAAPPLSFKDQPGSRWTGTALLDFAEGLVRQTAVARRPLLENRGKQNSSATFMQSRHVAEIFRSDDIHCVVGSHGAERRRGAESIAELPPAAGSRHHRWFSNMRTNPCRQGEWEPTP